MLVAGAAMCFCLFVFGAGDLAYADTKLATTPESVWYRTELWDRFGRLVETFGSKVPFVTTIGNHEVDYEINTQPVVSQYNSKGLSVFGDF